jgi:hypothetical protein
MALLTVAVFRASRLISKDSITSFIRSPFTRFAGQAGPDELKEEVVGTGIRHAIGELLTCPFCLTVWLATTAAFGLLLFPRPTRWVCSVLGIVAGSDALQFLYSALEQAAT